MKPGYRTSEFYATLATLVVSALVTIELIAPADEGAATLALADALAAGAALVSAAAVVARYIHARTSLKQSE